MEYYKVRPSPPNKGFLRVFVISFLIVCTAYYLLSFFGPEYELFQIRWMRCIGQLREGAIYSGLPECEQPPMIFFYGWVLDTLGFEDLQMASILPFIILNSLALVLASSICGLRDIESHIFFSVCYCLSVLPSLSYGMASAFSLVFGLLALSYFGRRKAGKNLFISSAFLGLALWSKVTALSLFSGLLMILFVVDVLPLINRKRVLEDIGRLGGVFILRLAAFCAPAFVFCLIAVLIFPNILAYTIFSHQQDEALGYREAFWVVLEKDLFSESNYLIFSVLLILAIYGYYRGGYELWIVFAVSFATSFVARFKPRVESPDIFTVYYLVFPLVLFLICVFYEANRRGYLTRSKLHVLFVVFFLFFGGAHLPGSNTVQQYLVEKTYLSQKNDVTLGSLERSISYLEQLFNGYFRLLPESDGKVLVNSQVYEILLKTPTRIDMSKVVNKNSPPNEYRYYPSDYGAGLMRLGFESADFFEVNALEVELARKIENREYDMIMVGPSAWDSQISYAIRNMSSESRNMYCIWYVPTFDTSKNVRHWSTILFLNDTKCTEFADKTIEYSYAIWDNVCLTDHWASNMIKSIMGINQYNTGNGIRELLINRDCRSHVDAIGLYNRLSKNATARDSLRITMFVIFISVAATIWARR